MRNYRSTGKLNIHDELVLEEEGELEDVADEHSTLVSKSSSDPSIKLASLEVDDPLECAVLHSVVPGQLHDERVAQLHLGGLTDDPVVNVVVLHVAGGRTVSRRVREQDQGGGQHHLVCRDLLGHTLGLPVLDLGHPPCGSVQVPQRDRLRQHERDHDVRRESTRLGWRTVLRCVLDVVEAQGAGRVQNEHEDLLRVRGPVHARVSLARVDSTPLQRQGNLRAALEPQSHLDHCAERDHHLHIGFLLGQGNALDVATHRDRGAQHNDPTGHGWRLRLQTETDDRDLLVGRHAHLRVLFHR